MAFRLLIVDDEEVLCESLRRVFLKEGYEVDCAYCSEAALKLMQMKPYNLIVSDVMLPDMNGIELLGMCRKYNPNLIFIFMTAYASIDSAVASIKSGAFEYLVKPIDHEYIKTIVKKSLTAKTPATNNSITPVQAYPFSQQKGNLR
jgi:two-component system, NtrC family, response regulator AtoC